MRIAVNGVVNVAFYSHALQSVAELVGGPLAVVVSDDNRAHHELSVHKLVAQAQHILVVGNAKVGANLVFLYVVGTHHNHYLY